MKMKVTYFDNRFNSGSKEINRNKNRRDRNKKIIYFIYIYLWKYASSNEFFLFFLFLPTIYVISVTEIEKENFI